MSKSGLYPTGSIVTAFRDLIATDGLRGMFRGFTATAARDAPYAGMYMAFYEKGKDILGESLIVVLVEPETSRLMIRGHRSKFMEIGSWLAECHDPYSLGDVSRHAGNAGDESS